MKSIPNLANFYTWMVRLAVALGLFIFTVSSIFMFANKDIAPDWDMVSVIDFLIRGVSGTEPNLLSADVFRFKINEHQPYLPMLIWGFDFKVFHSYGLLPQVLMQLFAITSVVLVTGWSRSRSNPQILLPCAAIFSGCALYLCPLQWENLVWPNQILLYTSIILSVLAISVAVPISKRNWPQQVLRALLSSFFAVCATFSFGWGLVVWPVLLIHGLLSRWTWQGFLTILLLSVGTITLYFSQFNVVPHHGNPIESLFDPISVVNFASLLLASPIVVAAGLSNALGYVLGYLLLAAFTYVAYRVYIQRQVVDDRQLRSLLVCLFCIGVCLMTALGRSALAYRYMLIPTLFFIAMPGLFPLRTPIKSGGKQLAMIAFLIGFLGLSGASYLNDDALRSRQFMIRDGAIAAAFGTKPLHRGLSTGLDKINNHVWPFYIKHHGDSKSVNVLTWLGKPIPKASLPDPSASIGSQSMGHVDTLENREGDPEFDITQGWVRLGPKGRRKAEWVIITNASGIVVGLATTGRDRPDVREHLKANWLDDLMTQTNRAGFSGLIRSQPGDELDFFAYKDGKCFQFAEKVKAPDAN